jgi:hypothetical protein
MDVDAIPGSPSRRDGATRRQMDNVTVAPLTVKMLMQAKREVPKTVYSLDDFDLHNVCREIFYSL